MAQYHEIKAEYPDTLLFFQVGDFYELFFEDAKQAAAYLGIALTARGKNKGEPIPLCGVPVHAKDHYVTKLIKGGFKVAVCDQLEPPRPGAAVKRGVAQVLSPGTLSDEQLLDKKSPSYLLSFFPTKDACALIFGELMTAQMFATILPADGLRTLEAELVRFFPDEVLIPQNKLAKPFVPFFKKLGYFTSPVHTEKHEQGYDQELDEWLNAQFNDTTRSAVRSNHALYWSLYYFYAYLKKNQSSSLSLFHQLNLYQPDDFLLLDAATQRNLELIKNSQDGGRSHTLYAVLDRAVTPMGSRMIRKWIARPLIKKEAIEQRLEVVQLFKDQISLCQQVGQLLKMVGDIERVIGRIALRRATVHDYSVLSGALDHVPVLKKMLAEHTQKSLVRIICSQVGDFSELKHLLQNAFYQIPHEQWIIKQGFDKKLDHVRDLAGNSNKKILDLELHEQQVTGINSLKIRYNKVHGYYIEVTKTHLDAIPAHYIQQQTLVGRQRYTTPALQQLQGEIIHARAEIEQVEKLVYEQVKNQVELCVPALRKLAHALAHVDALLGFAHAAYENRYSRPVFHEQQDICISNGRHPVVEQSCSGSFIPNDTMLTDNQFLWIITGPNMGGKSTYLRQTALVCVMAQCGAFVPADQASLPLLDRVFTRIGAGDNLAGGKSTFLVEMEETASICSLATNKSLVILDEVGRGTSTFDGLAIAQGVVEHIYDAIKARCLFATHYHELTQLEKKYPGIASYFAASKKTETGIIFLYKIVRGIADGSFGIEVARLAQLPPEVINRAQRILQSLESGEHFTPSRRNSEGVALQQQLLRLQKKASQHEQIVAQIKDLNYDELSPRMAFDILWKIKELV